MPELSFGGYQTKLTVLAFSLNLIGQKLISDADVEKAPFFDNAIMKYAKYEAKLTSDEARNLECIDAQIMNRGRIPNSKEESNVK
ncbi:hypothetical protein BHYA_0185g00210 [Botrytis hyacinthi]|uniref:Uncharacterized protein n=1 Tax=Botrytis hyacinthi TaxID=278943 RepID=A0A4Z1GLV7_9HELO|nr:hypothetical protein BHYA_0185g00210 [Botrytis hyacinthi]